LNPISFEPVKLCKYLRENFLRIPVFDLVWVFLAGVCRESVEIEGSKKWQAIKARILYNLAQE
jgi:hypothetical protein